MFLRLPGGILLAVGKASVKPMKGCAEANFGHVGIGLYGRFPHARGRDAGRPPRGVRAYLASWRRWKDMLADMLAELLHKPPGRRRVAPWQNHPIAGRDRTAH